MLYKKLGTTNIDVSVVCLGTMTFGEQTNAQESFAELDYAFDNGVNFIDAAEMYPVPPRAETYGGTEEIVGDWIAANPDKRDKVIVATKVVGPATRFRYMRPQINDGVTKLDRASIELAIEGSLKRLKTDYIDLYQLHWPDRNTNIFDRLGYTHSENEVATPLQESLSVLHDLVKAGKIRYVGLSNETPYGLVECMRLAREEGLPLVQSVQNPYNLLKRDYEIGMAEISCRSGIGLLAYSPLAMGALTGKYLDGKMPEGSRFALFGQYFPRYQSLRAQAEIKKYVALAHDYGLDPAVMANAYVNGRAFVTSNIIGATTLEQLKPAVASGDVILPDDLLAKIEKTHRENPVGY